MRGEHEREGGGSAADAGASAAARLRADLEAVGFRPTKSRGQNFLLDGNLARAIVEDAGLAPGARVLEVGAGPGALTEALARRGHELVAVEIDPRLCDLARARLSGFPGVRFLELDVLERGAIAPAVLAALEPWPEWHLVSNLPYSITGPLLMALARLERPPRSMTVLIQDEVAERIAAEPGGREWGGLSAKLALRYERTRGRAVGPQLFWPRPRVESRVVRLVRRAEPLDPGAAAAYDGLVAGLFQGRRKTLRKALIQAGWEREHVDRVLAGYPGWRERRPEEFGPAELLSLAQSLGISGRDIP